MPLTSGNSGRASIALDRRGNETTHDFIRLIPPTAELCDPLMVPLASTGSGRCHRGLPPAKRPYILPDPCRHQRGKFKLDFHIVSNSIDTKTFSSSSLI